MTLDEIKLPLIKNSLRTKKNAITHTPTDCSGGYLRAFPEAQGAATDQNCQGLVKRHEKACFLLTLSVLQVNTLCVCTE